MTKSRRAVALVAALALALAALAATAAASGGKVLVWTIQRTENNAENAAVKSFKNASVQIFANDPYKQKLSVSLGSGKGPDVFMNWGGGGLKQYVDAHKVVDLTPYLNADKKWKNRFFANVLQTAAFDGRDYGIPNVGMQPVLLFYNKAVFAKYNLQPPKTWADLLNVVKTLKDNSVTPFILGGQSKWPDLMWEEYLVDRVGGPQAFDAVAAGKKNAWSNPDIIKANTMLQQLVDAGAFGSFESTTYDGTVTATLLGTGKGAMELMGNWEYGAVLQNSPNTIKNNELGWQPFPSVPGGKGNPKDLAGNTSNFYSISSSTKNLASAVKFLKTQVMSPAYIKTLISDGDIPPVKGIQAQLKKSANATFTLYNYNLVQNAPHFQHSWDQVLSPAAASALLTNLDRLLLKQITPQQFSANMNKVK
ncbi:MAG TPA: extracellular solute-binding protein [Gaiellaceae bacterium]|jgi:ABC-type glycerol-3-phosphate transport system substrate-binding protein|nr:extracellular solute-binding protein [Gaiellaceae bacterium]